VSLRKAQGASAGAGAHVSGDDGRRHGGSVEAARGRREWHPQACDRGIVCVFLFAHVMCLTQRCGIQKHGTILCRRASYSRAACLRAKAGGGLGTPATWRPFHCQRWRVDPRRVTLATHAQDMIVSNHEARDGLLQAFDGRRDRRHLHAPRRGGTLACRQLSVHAALPRRIRCVCRACRSQVACV
jgi:hypothetical protein